MKQPLVSVILPAYNAEKYILESVKSILNQTYSNFELLLIDDGSTDNTLEKVQSLEDSRLKIVYNEKNLGLIASLNKGLQQAVGKYVARMDADDIAMPQRLEMQVDFMGNNPEYIICGTAIEAFGSDTKPQIVHYPQTHNEILWHMLYQCPFSHPTVMLKKSVFLENNLFYNDSFIHCEDFELWFRLVGLGKMKNLSEPLLKYRKHEGSVSYQFKLIQEKYTKIVIKNYWNKLGVSIRLTQLDVINGIFYREFRKNTTYINESEQILFDLWYHASKSNYFTSDFLANKISQLWYHLCLNSGEMKLNEFILYQKSNLPKKSILFIQKIKLLIKKIIL